MCVHFSMLLLSILHVFVCCYYLLYRVVTRYIVHTTDDTLARRPRFLCTLIPLVSVTPLMLARATAYADAPEYWRMPRSQNHRAPISIAAASANAPSKLCHVNRPASASAGTVIANATGTTSVSTVRSHPG